MGAFSPDEWPAPAECVDGELADIPESALAGALADTAAAQSDEETRYYLNGILFERTAGAFLRTAATDGHRLHIHDTGWHWPAMGVERTNTETGETDREPSVIVPRLAVTALLHCLKGATIARDVLIESDGHRLDITGDGWRVLTKTIDGSYPDYERIVNGAFAKESDVEERHVVELSAGPTLDTMRAIKVSGADRSHSAKFDFEAGEIRAGNVDVGMSRHPLARVNGECTLAMIGLNASLIADVAERFDESATFTLTMTDAGSPVGVSSASKPGFRAVVMPLRV